MFLFLPFVTKDAYVHTKNLPDPNKITRAALGLLGTFSMSAWLEKEATIGCSDKDFFKQETSIFLIKKTLLKF